MIRKIIISLVLLTTVQPALATTLRVPKDQKTIQAEPLRSLLSPRVPLSYSSRPTAPSLYGEIAMRLTDVIEID
ncbi:MAG TPA: hypothetical protein DDZ51_13085 [Planctomycetaceae bacterium]|nr:hypothetical protein [Planctomycetaceae bacterium]